MGLSRAGYLAAKCRRSGSPSVPVRPDVNTESADRVGTIFQNALNFLSYSRGFHPLLSPNTRRQHRRILCHILLIEVTPNRQACFFTAIIFSIKIIQSELRPPLREE